MSIRERIREVKHLRNHYFICVLENPQDIKNIGTTIRNISAFGVEKLYLVGDVNISPDFSSTRNNRRLSELSVGASKWVFVKYFATTAECMAHLRKNLYTIAVTSPHQKGKKNVELYDDVFTQKRLAVWFGSESKGISEEAVSLADLCIQIPMGGVVESLNLGTSTGIVLSYIGHQRLRFVYDNDKVNFKPRGLAKLRKHSLSRK